MLGDSRKQAAAKVTILEEALAKVGTDPILAEACKNIEKELEKQRMAAKDGRSAAIKLEQKKG